MGLMKPHILHFNEGSRGDRSYLVHDWKPGRVAERETKEIEAVGVVQ